MRAFLDRVERKQLSSVLSFLEAVRLRFISRSSRKSSGEKGKERNRELRERTRIMRTEYINVADVDKRERTSR